MYVLELIQSLPALAGSLPLDDNTLGVLALLAGMSGGWYLTGLREQLKAKKVKVERKENVRPRKPD
jgi:hypothetical protein